MTSAVLTLVATAGAALAGSGVSGFVPRELGTATHIVWVAADEAASSQADCSLQPHDAWSCEFASSAPSGVIVLVGDTGMASLGIERGASQAEIIVSRWGRAVRLALPARDDEDARSITVTAWTPDRSSARLRTERFTPARDDGVTIVRLANGAWWIAGDRLDPDAYVLIDGPDLAPTKIPAGDLAVGPPDIPYLVVPDVPRALSGRVETKAGRPVDGALVELFAPLARDRHGPVDVPVSWIRHAATRADADGRFVFDRIGEAPYEIVASDDERGRAVAAVSDTEAPLVIRLVAPLRATGRVLRRAQPAAGARVRFVPEAKAWAASVDPAAHISRETTTDADGQFRLTLPPERAGTIQFIAADGPSLHLRVPPARGMEEIPLGDVALADLRHVTIRLLDLRRCEITAAGPLGLLGLTLVRASGTGGVYWLELPEPGTWQLGADCDGAAVGLDPPVVIVRADGPEPTIDVRLADSR